MNHGTAVPATETADVSQEIIERAQSMLSRCEVGNIRPTAISAARGDGNANLDAVHVSVDSAFHVSEDAFAGRYTWTIGIDDDGGVRAADLAVTILVEFQLGPDFVPDQEAADFITATTGYFAVYPYVREIVQDLTTRLQLDPTVLGFLRRGDKFPDAANFVRRELVTAARGEDLAQS